MKDCDHTIGLAFEKEDVFLAKDIYGEIEDFAPIYGVNSDEHRAIMEVKELKISNIQQTSIPYRHCPYCGVPMSHQAFITDDGEKEYKIIVHTKDGNVEHSQIL
jgi:hypothetical protein